MPFFPQLSTGSLAQYPLRLTQRQRAAVNDALGGERFTSFDEAGGEMEWDLPYRGLSVDETASLRALFEECEGRRGEFTFADPCGNLLARSEQFEQPPWQSDALLGWTAGVSDPWGGAAAMRAQNASGSVQAVRQTVALPAGMNLCFSVWGRSLGASEVVVRRTSGTESMAAAFPMGGDWRRIETAGALAGASTGVTFAIEVPGAAAIELFGAQVEAQRGASGYRRTLARAGVYESARFAQDELTIVADGYATHSARLRVVARL